MRQKLVWGFVVVSLFTFSNYFTYINGYDDGLNYGVSHNVEQYQMSTLLQVLSYEKSDFSNAIERSLEYEGGYSNSKNDLGGETIFGISRNFFPDEEIWEDVDKLKKRFNVYGYVSSTDKKARSIANELISNKECVENIHNFYRKTFWDKLQLASIPKNLSELVFDMTINIGSVNTIKYLQQLLNAMNNKNRLHSGYIIEDGIFGLQTQEALKKAINLNYVKQLVVGLKSLRGYHYINISNIRNKNKDYTIGWLNRI